MLQEPIRAGDRLGEISPLPADDVRLLRGDVLQGNSSLGVSCIAVPSLSPSTAPMEAVLTSPRQAELATEQQNKCAFAERAMKEVPSVAPPFSPFPQFPEKDEKTEAEQPPRLRPWEKKWVPSKKRTENSN